MNVIAILLSVTTDYTLCRQSCALDDCTKYCFEIPKHLSNILNSYAKLHVIIDFIKVLSLMLLHLLTFLNCSRLLRIVFAFHRIISTIEKLLSESQVFCSLPPPSLSLYLSPIIFIQFWQGLKETNIVLGCSEFFSFT